jgi:hypothetical protein
LCGEEEIVIDCVEGKGEVMREEFGVRYLCGSADDEQLLFAMTAMTLGKSKN